MRQLSALVPVALALFALAACVDPLVDDDVDQSALVLPSGAHVPQLADDPAALAALASKLPPSLRGTIHANGAFSEGTTVTWWDLGPAQPSPLPGYLLVREADDGDYLADGRRFSPIEHPVIRSSIPGDLGYAPIWRVSLVPVTARYAGELLTSVDAVDAAVEAGLVEPPLRVPYARNAPVVLASTRLEVAPGGALEAPTAAYYKGRVIYTMPFGELFVPGGTLPVGAQYQLRREGGEPISEVARGVDMTGDGDASDTNDLFAPGYSPLVQMVDVVVAPDTEAIDSYRNDSESDLTSAAQLFDNDGRTPTATVVRSIHPTTTVFNRPSVKRPRGAP